MNKRTTIELNGKTYDAVTGELLGENRIKATPATRNKVLRQGRTIDGFVPGKLLGPKQRLAPTVIKPQPQVQQAPKMSVPHSAHHKGAKIAKNPVFNDINVKQAAASRTVARTVAAKAPLKAPRQQPQRPKTLMRHVVKKPVVTMKPSIKMTAPSELAARPASDIARPLEKKLSVSQVNPIRLARSRHVAKSHHIQRFRQPKQATQNAHSSHQIPATVPGPVYVTTDLARPQQYALHSTRTAQARAVPRPLKQQVQAVPTPPAPSQAATASTAPTPSTDIFEAALAHAKSHQEQPVKFHSVRRKRFVNIMAGIGAFLLIGGFVGYLNLTNIELRIASMRAGFSAELPDYKPTGYALAGGIESNGGKVRMTFRSGDSAYTITQQSSDWNSATLLDQEAAEQGSPLQTIQSKGRTIYIYENSVATWVNGGVRYEVQGNASLNSEDLVALATSM